VKRLVIGRGSVFADLLIIGEAPGEQEDLEGKPYVGKSGKLLNELLVTMQKGCLCALCGAIPTPIMNILKYFGDEMKSDMVKDN